MPLLLDFRFHRRIDTDIFDYDYQQFESADK